MNNVKKIRMFLSIETAPLMRPNDLTYAAAQLFVSEIAVFKDFTPERYLAICKPQAETLYVGTVSEYGLIAAAKVMHRNRLSSRGTTQTYVKALAVHRDFRKQNNCREMVCHIAHRAIDYGDTWISLLPTEKNIDGNRRQVESVFMSLGFDYELGGADLDARPETILAHYLAATAISTS